MIENARDELLYNRISRIFYIILLYFCFEGGRGERGGGGEGWVLDAE